MPDERLNASALLDTHQFERSRADVDPPPVIVSVLVGPTTAARACFVSWANAKGLSHHVACIRELEPLTRALRFHRDDAAVVFAPERGEFMPAFTCALALAQAQRRRPLAVLVSSTELVSLLAGAYREHAVGFRQALLLGLAPIEPGSEVLRQKLKGAPTIFYRSSYEQVLHSLMTLHPDVGDIFAVNARVRPVASGKTFEVDFWCEPLRLAVEVDGLQHRSESQRARDYERDETLGRAGVATLRIHAAAVFTDPTATIAQVVAAVAARRREITQHER